MSGDLPRTLGELKTFLGAHGLRPRKRFGQNFMVDRNMLRVMTEAAALEPTDRVLEIGTGTGLLTLELAAACESVVTVEADDDLAAIVHPRLDPARVRCIHGDVLEGKHALAGPVAETIETWGDRGYKVVANLPYNVSVPFLLNLLGSPSRPRLALVTVQREVADRFVGVPGTKDYGKVSVELQLRAAVRRLRDLPPAVFWPRPEVSSSIVELRPGNRRLDPAPSDEIGFRVFLERLFGARRKTIAAALGLSRTAAVSAFSAVDVPVQARAETLEPGRLVALFDALSSADLLP